VNDIHFTSKDEIHTLGHMYESMLREMRDAAGDSGEFYTPRSLVKFIITVVDPRLGEKILDPAAGTGGFLVEAFEHLRALAKASGSRRRRERTGAVGPQAQEAHVEQGVEEPGGRGRADCEDEGWAHASGAQGRARRGSWTRAPSLAVTLQAADQGDTTTLDETLCEAGEQVAEQIRREVELRPQDKPKVNLQGIEELVTDKGYHSSAVVQRMKSYEVRSYIPEKKPKGRRDWARPACRAAGGVRESATSAGRVRQELIATTR
jgi:hypothetical protein